MVCHVRLNIYVANELGHALINAVHVLARLAERDGLLYPLRRAACVLRIVKRFLPGG